MTQQNNYINKIAANPRQLFLIDGLGALLSTFLLGVVLVQFEDFFGIPTNVLYFLAFLPCLFAIYDFYCYQKVPDNIDFYIKIIAVANLLYCLLSMGLALYHFQKITIYGWIYILLEILILILLITIQFKIVGKGTEK
jgi:hypothetical protein